ncbi:DUF6970 domain-containing protein [Rufibacter roseus]|uniref:DUF6970 domain-containing protein n=1 Tax=Rufibacter roseus TaxID=1567108 RepID=A0ABW2DES4_9BACT|nr:hypothetical protein [Rufibacter roseus]
MNYLRALCLLLLLSFTACEEEDIQQTCTVADPAQNIAWLKEKVKDLQASEYCQVVQRGMLNGRSVFVIQNCDPAINAIRAVYDCDGNVICYSGDDTCPNFESEVKRLEVVWSNGK